MERSRRRRRNRALDASTILIVIALTACVGSPSSSSGTAVPKRTPVPAAERGDPPPLAIQQSLDAKTAVFVPLSDAELASVAVSVSDAQAVALESGARGPEHFDRLGFTYLGSWVPPMESLGHAAVPDPVPAYIVQIFAGSSSDYPVGASEFVAVDASTGEALLVVGSCWGADCSGER